MFFDVVTIGSATQDVFLLQKDVQIVTSKKFLTGKAECFMVGSKVEVDGVVFDTGGGATNAAVTLRRAGIKTGIFTRIGKDPAGNEVLRVLKQEKVNTSLIQIDKQHGTAYSSVLLMDEGERTILVYRGAAGHWLWEEFPIQSLKTKWIYLTSLGGNKDFFLNCCQWARANNVKMCWNPGMSELEWGWDFIEEYGGLIEVLLINREEACMLTKKLFDNIEGTYLALRRSKFPLIVVTDGKRGATAYPEHGKFFVEAFSSRAINTTGAGDAFGSALLAGLMKFRGDLPMALRLAAYNSGLVVSEMGPKHGIMKRIPSTAVLKKIKVKEE